MEGLAWYASKGRHDEGKKALKRLVGNVEGYDIDREYSVIQYEMDESSATAKSGNENSDWKVSPGLISSLLSTLQIGVICPVRA